MMENDRSARAAAARERRADQRKTRRSRWITVGILVVAVVLISVVGVEFGPSEPDGGTGRSTPFSLILDLDTINVTSTTLPAITTTTSTSTTSTTSTTTPVAVVERR